MNMKCIIVDHQVPPEVCDRKHASSGVAGVYKGEGGSGSSVCCRQSSKHEGNVLVTAAVKIKVLKEL